MLILFKLMTNVVAIVVRRVWTDGALAEAKMAMRTNKAWDDRFSLRIHHLCPVRNLGLSR